MGMASSPVPTMPAANSSEAAGPAIGLRARAASSAVRIVLDPWAPRALPVATMMANITPIPALIPLTIPRRAAVSWTAEASGSETSVVQTRPKRNWAPICE